MATVSEALRAAVDLHQKNRLQEAADLYVRILEADPSVADAWHLLGVLHHQVGQHGKAVEFIAAAIARDPSCAAYHDNLGSARRAEGNADGAAGCHRRALALSPDWVTPLGNLGNALVEAQRPEAAAAAYRRALWLEPAQDSLRLRLADCLQGMGRSAEADPFYTALLAAQPERPDLRYRLGLAKLGASRLMTATLSDAGRVVDSLRVGEALSLFGAAARSGHAEARRNLFGTAILALQRGVLDDATLHGVAAAARAHLRHNPRDTTALAVVCYDLYRAGRLEVAYRFFRKHARHFTAEEISCDFELLVWSLVQTSRGFFSRLDGYDSRRFQAAAHRELVPAAGEGRPVLLVGCDDGYWRRFGAAFLESWRERAPSCAAHVHLINPSDETVEALRRLCGAAGGLSCSMETVELAALPEPVRLTYFASARFAVARRLLNRGAAPVVQVDVDAVMLEDVGAAMRDWPAGWDIAIMRDRRGRGPMRDFLAGFMAFNPTPAGRAYLDRVVAYIGWHFDAGRVYWTLDQAAPYCVHDWMRRAGAEPSVVWHDFGAFPYLRFLDK
ncbi:tetratricopeptide repeat protein [Azospirillum isscasi]|uniref:Tetratricopeptide repeat protein n=1 Tax=Azospirillum isscasi TaxID=3053926 RepID=A0ABU0WE48_9PROT|nr:tetratricopeptide repeat protein [Azospirillum isscasi]MDQ2102479.1 tetratricopeptide repeat protein [Azospirillum isscasi]